MQQHKTIHSLQAMRAIAAWLVIIDHTLLEMTHNNVQDPLTHLAWTLGSSGVFIFFIISGFIMVYISWNGFGRTASAARFVKRRFIRVAPLYWLATLAALAYHKVSATHGAHDGWPELLQSLAFIPYAGSENSWSPILPQGWTLSYEMMFYAVFAVGLLFKRAFALPAITILLGLFVIIGPRLSLPAVTYISSPIIIWFVLGMAMAAIWEWRGLTEPAWLASSAVFLEIFGNASYSTYLFHGFVLTVILRVWVRMEGSSASFWIVPASLVAATITGLVIYRFLEKPILRFGSRLGKILTTRASGSRVDSKLT